MFSVKRCRIHKSFKLSIDYYNVMHKDCILYLYVSVAFSFPFVVRVQNSSCQVGGEKGTCYLRYAL
jgi:hypothetical protein